MSDKEKPMTTNDDIIQAVKALEGRLAREPFPALENCGTYLAKDNKGNWYYLNHANTWQGYQGPENVREPTAFNWTPAMEAIWPKDMRPTMSGLLAIWAAMSEAAVYSASVADADGWVRWDGGECPVSYHTRVDVKYRDGDKKKDNLSSGLEAVQYWWGRAGGDGGEIIAYRVLP